MPLNRSYELSRIFQTKGINPQNFLTELNHKLFKTKCDRSQNTARKYGMQKITPNLLQSLGTHESNATQC